MNKRKLAYLACILSLGVTAEAQNIFGEPLQAGSKGKVKFEAGRSYTCVMEFNESDYSGSISTNVIAPSGETIVGFRPLSPEGVEQIGGVELINERIGRFDSSPINNFVAFSTLPGADGAGEYTFEIAAAAEGMEADEVEFRCTDTTQVCTFNTAVNDFNFLEITNTGNQDVAVNFTTVDFEGVATTSTGFVADGERVDFDIHSSVGANKFGYILVHPMIVSGLNQSVRARLSQYKGSDLSHTEVCQPGFLFPEYVRVDSDRDS